MKLKSLILDKSFLNSYNSHLFVNRIYGELQFLENEYPNFKDWYYHTVIKEIISNGNRKIIVKIINSEIAGISILKKSIIENKICTLRITDKYKGLGIGTELLNHSIQLLQDEKPLITVSSNRLIEFNKLLNNFEFKLNSIYPSIYKKGLSEYSFNSELTNNLHRQTLHNNVYKALGNKQLSCSI